MRVEKVEILLDSVLRNKRIITTCIYVSI
jgi:hypothetical protein